MECPYRGLGYSMVHQNILTIDVSIQSLNHHVNMLSPSLYRIFITAAASDSYHTYHTKLSFQPPLQSTEKMKTIIDTNKMMKPAFTLLSGLLFLIFVRPDISAAQQIDTGVDFYSTYVFRGVAFSGPSIQPYVEFSTGGFSIGAWGSQGIDGLAAEGDPGFQEMDLYANYEFDFGLSLGITDYYYPGTDYFDGGTHAFELNAGFEIDILSLSANYILNETEGAGSAGNDLYFELGLGLGMADLFVGAGDGWHSSDGEFAVVNVGLGVSKEIPITDTFSIPLSGAVVLNPHTEQFYIVVGVSF